MEVLTIVAVDDEKIALEGLEDAIREAVPDAEVCGFRNADDVLDFVKNAHCDVAFLDIEMRQTNGIELARQLKMANKDINIIFATGYNEYTRAAFALHASGYIMKPVTPEKVRLEMDDLRHPVQQQSDKKIRVQTFGNFEVFFDGKPIKFQYSKTKELLAYLVDRNGAMCTNGEVMGILWEDEANSVRRTSYWKNLRADLEGTLGRLGCGDVIVRQRGKIGVVPEKIECDYYDWLEGNAYAINAYRGEYMIQYSWSEFSYGTLNQ